MDATPTRSNITSYGSAIPIQPGDTFTLELPDGRRGEYVADTVTVASPSMPYVSKRPAGLLYAAELEVGKTYRVEFSDCCVRGEFTSVFAAGVRRRRGVLGRAAFRQRGHVHRVGSGRVLDSRDR